MSKGVNPRRVELHKRFAEPERQSPLLVASKEVKNATSTKGNRSLEQDSSQGGGLEKGRARVNESAGARSGKGNLGNVECSESPWENRTSLDARNHSQ